MVYVCVVNSLLIGINSGLGWAKSRSKWMLVHWLRCCVPDPGYRSGQASCGMVLVCGFLVGCTGWRNGTCINCRHGTSVWRNRSVQVSLCNCNLELPNCGVSVSVCKRCEISPSCIKIWSKWIQASYYYCCHCYGSVQDMESSVVSTVDIFCHLHCHYYRSAPWSLNSGHFSVIYTVIAVIIIDQLRGVSTVDSSLSSTLSLL